MKRVRAGVIICPIWGNLREVISGDYAILVHYIRTADGVESTAAFTRYNGVLTDITEKFRTLTLNPDWRERL